MYTKVVLVAAALAPVALAQATIEPYNFDCSQGQYGYGWNNGGSNNGGSNNGDLSFTDIINQFDGISNIFQDCSNTTRTAPSGDIPQIAQTLFDYYRDAVCQTLSLKDALTQIRETDNEQHQVCLGKAYYDLTLNNWMMNMEGQLSPLKGSFTSNNLPSISSCTQGLHSAFQQLSAAVNQVAPICTAQENTSTSLVRNTLNVVAQAFHL